MYLSVITAVDDHVLDAGKWFDALAAQTADPGSFEAIAVDPYAMREWERAAREPRAPGGPRFAYRPMEVKGRAHALNAGLDEARGDVVVFLADDFIPGPDYVELHQRFHEEHPERQAVGVGRAMIPKEMQRGPFVAWLESTGRFFGAPLDEETGEVPEDFFYVGNASVKRELIDAAGRFDEDFPYHAWDDYEYGLRLREQGMRSRLIPGADVVHDHAIDLQERLVQMREAGESAAIHERKAPGDHPWLGPGEVPVWRWRAAAWKWRLAHLVTRRERYLGLYYDRILNWSYASGLRTGRAA